MFKINGTQGHLTRKCRQGAHLAGPFIPSFGSPGGCPFDVALYRQISPGHYTAWH